MQAYLFSLNKRSNSTKRPTLTDGIDIAIQLKEPTSIINPVITINPASTGMGAVFAYNYMFIPQFQRYYYITDAVYLNGIWELNLTSDAMASFRGGIGSTTVYVERASAQYDGNIVDGYFPATTDFSIQRSAVGYAYNGVAPSGGCYVIGLINYQTSNHIGAVSYYACTISQLNTFLQYLFSNNIYNASSISEIGQGLFYSLFNPFQYVVSCIWFPFGASTFGSEAAYLKVGYWQTNALGVMVSNLAHKTYITATIPSHPESASKGAYLNYAPYSRYTLFIPPFGEIPLDSNFRSIGNYLYSPLLVDHITGQGTLQVAVSPSSTSLNESNVMTERSAMIGVPIQLAQVMSDYSNAIHAISPMGGAIGTALSLVSAGLMSAVDAMAPKVSTSGANGSFNEVLAGAHLISEFARITGGASTILGRPLMQVKTVSELGGYMKCINPHPSLNCTPSELNQIEQYMTEGFYYE